MFKKGLLIKSIWLTVMLFLDYELNNQLKFICI